MNVAMEEEMKVAVEAENRHENSSCSFSPEVLPPENHDDSPTHHTRCPGTFIPRPGTVIPNRIFVGGIDYKVNESDLRHVFSQHGAVKEVKIVIDRSGLSKGYGFVTFESQDDALKILNDAKGICFKDKKLNIGQAVRRQQATGQTKSALVPIPDSATPQPISCGTTPAGFPYIYHNGVAYFHCPNMPQPFAHHWPVSHQPVYQQPAYHHHQCAPNQYQWNVVQSPMPPSPVVYPQPSEYLYQPADGGPVQPPLPVMEDTTPEFVEPTLLQVYPSYPPRTDGMTPIVLQHDPRKNLMFPHAQVHLKPKYHRFIRHEDYHYLQEAAEPPGASMLHTHQPLIYFI
ncbi:protein boule-like isoform X2 [Cebidichthys violaceus]|uniref:protein boule-like isoform X2 n=1 Tax=Cebidichthys violaceus TaxID=271503 RepID=UPI0035CB0DFD